MSTQESPVTADALRSVHKALTAAQEALDPFKDRSEELKLAAVKLIECLLWLKLHDHAGRWTE